MKCNCNQSRRDFLKNSSLIIASAGIALYSAPVENKTTDSTAAKKPATITLDLTKKENEKLLTPGNAVYVDNPSDKAHPIIVYRKTTESMTAFSSKCTHKGGPVQLEKSGKFVCQFHKAEFDADGKVQKGPAQKDLPGYPVTFNAKTVIISLPLQ